ncbi:hypothetical protein C8R44DRAFT_813545, partial [Mycena epipterygia]
MSSKTRSKESYSHDDDLSSTYEGKHEKTRITLDNGMETQNNRDPLRYTDLGMEKRQKLYNAD